MGVIFLARTRTTATVMKLIFLDVDGVLNRDSTEGKFADECVELLAEIVNRTQAKIVLSSTWRYTDETRNILRSKLQEHSILAANEDFVGFTPHLGLVDFLPRFPSPNSHATRTDEILLWIRYNTVPEGTKSKSNAEVKSSEEAYNPFSANPEETLTQEALRGMNLCTVGEWLLSEPVEVYSFVVLDDLPMLKEGCYGSTLERNFVHTSMETGLTRKNVEEAVTILNSRSVNLMYGFKRWRKATFRACSNPDCLLLGEDDNEAREQRRQERRRTQNPNACYVS